MSAGTEGIVRRMRIATVILAGGAGVRIGGDKPLRLLGGRPLIAHVADRCTAPIWINAVDPRLADYGPLVPDMAAPGEGPLVGVWSVLRRAEAEGVDAVLTVPADTPFLPRDLGERLLAALGDRAAAVAVTPDGWQPACAVWRRGLAPVIADFLAAGRWSLAGALRAVGAVPLAFSADEAPLFFNINTPADLAEAEERLDHGQD